MTGLSLMPTPPLVTTDLLGAIVASLLAQTAGASDLALVLDSELDLATTPARSHSCCFPPRAAPTICSRRLGLPAPGRSDGGLGPHG